MANTQAKLVLTYYALKDDDLVTELNRESDRGAALIAAALLDEALKSALERRFVVRDTHVAQMFKMDNALGTFSMKIKLAYALGLYGSGVRADLDRIRKVRNWFAHGLIDEVGGERTVYSFETGRIANVCAALLTPTQLYKTFLMKEPEIIQVVLGDNATHEDTDRMRAQAELVRQVIQPPEKPRERYVRTAVMLASSLMLYADRGADDGDRSKSAEQAAINPMLAF